MKLHAISIAPAEPSGMKITRCQNFGHSISPVKFLTDHIGIRGEPKKEVAWKENYRLWMTFVNEYKNRGGRVTTGSDSGFIFQLYGFAYIREFELLREAGFHPLEIIRSATLYGAQALGKDKEIGSVEVGKLADFVIVDENPLQNLQVLYGTGAIKLTDDNKVVRVGGVKYTVKDGIIYDAKKLLADVRRIVAEEKAKTGFVLKQPGVE